jgi:hypothetical protein
MSAIAVAVVGGVAALGGAAIEASAAETAAGDQAQASANALGLQQSMYQTTLANESPFLQAGQGATSQLNYLLGTGTPGSGGTAASSTAGGFGSLNAPFNADTFKSMSPAYQFQAQQGAQGTLSQDASGSGALSGAALKDLTSFNQNFANTSFNNAFNQYQTQQSNTYQRLMGVASMGQGAASNQATGASNFGASIGQSATNIGTAQAGGAVGVANAISGGLSSAAGSASLPWLQANLSGANGGGTPAGTGYYTPGSYVGDPSTGIGSGEGL